MPPIPDGLRQELREAYAEHGLAWLQNELRQADPAYFATGEIQNPHRLLRALEVVKATGQSIRIFQQGKAADRPFTVVKMGLTLPRPELCLRIDARVDQMMEAGLLEEVKSLYPYRHLQALQTVGYQELFEYLEGHITLNQAVADIKTNTRRYAKRQMTWFRKDEAFQWFAPGETRPLIEFAASKVASQ
jgi:tRNA dimethylallyltransferase